MKTLFITPITFTQLVKITTASIIFLKRGFNLNFFYLAFCAINPMCTQMSWAPQPTTAEILTYVSAY